METQWEKVGVEGELVRTRMLYEVLDTTMSKMNGIGRRDWAEIFGDLRAMEMVALKVFNDVRNARIERERLAQQRSGR